MSDSELTEDEGASTGLVPLGDVLAELERRTREAASATVKELLPTARTPPAAVDAERALLGGLLIEPSAMERVVEEGLKPDDFYRRAHGLIYKVVLELHAAAEPVDTLTVVDELMRRGHLESVGGASAVSQLEALIPTAAHVGAYARLIREKATLRYLIETATQIVQAAYAQEQRVSEILDEAERAILAISESNLRKGIVPMHELVRRATEQLERAYEMKSAVTGVPSGFKDIDELTSGFQPGELIIVAARPSMGKCLAADSEILLADGSVATIEELFRRRSADLLTLGDDLHLRPASASAFVDDGQKPVFRVTTRLGRHVDATLPHPFLTVGGWRRLEALAPGDRIAVPRILPVFGEEAMPPAEVIILGYLLGDGCLTDGSPELTNTNPRIRDEYAEAVRALGPVTTRVEAHGGRAATVHARADVSVRRQRRAAFAERLRRALKHTGTTRRALARAVGVSPATITHWTKGSTSPRAAMAPRLAGILGLEEGEVRRDLEGLGRHERNRLHAWLDSLGMSGKRASNKEVPPCVFRLPRTQLAVFLNRLFATDGWATVLATGQSQLGFASISEKLARQVQHLLLRFGVVAHLRERRVKYGEERRRAWQLDITDARSIRTFLDAIGIFGKEEATERVRSALALRRYQTNRDLIPVEIWERIDALRGSESWTSLARRAGLGPSLHPRKRALTRDRLARLAAALRAPDLAALATSDVYWDEIVSIEPLGRQQVYDLTIPETHNFVANDICVHNTAFTLNVAAHAAMRAGLPVAFFSLEMGADQLVQRLLGSEARIDLSALRRGFIQRDQWSQLAQAAGQLSEAALFIDESPALTVAEMRTKCRRLFAEHGVKLIMVDYLQLMTGPPGIDNKATEVGEISKGLKSLARELSVPVIALSQLNRGVESRTDKRPMMSDLRESGAIEQDADLIMFLYREEYYLREKTPEDKLGIAEVIIGKHRNGPTGSRELRFFSQITRFENLTRDHDDYAP